MRPTHCNWQHWDVQKTSQDRLETHALAIMTTGCIKIKCPTRKPQFLRNAWISLHQILFVRSTRNCPQVGSDLRSKHQRMQHREGTTRVRRLWPATRSSWSHRSRRRTRQWYCQRNPSVNIHIERAVLNLCMCMYVYQCFSAQPSQIQHKKTVVVVIE